MRGHRGAAEAWRFASQGQWLPVASRTSKLNARSTRHQIYAPTMVRPIQRGRLRGPIRGAGKKPATDIFGRGRGLTSIPDLPSLRGLARRSEARGGWNGGSWPFHRNPRAGPASPGSTSARAQPSLEMAGMRLQWLMTGRAKAIRCAQRAHPLAWLSGVGEKRPESTGLRRVGTEHEQRLGALTEHATHPADRCTTSSAASAQWGSSKRRRPNR